MRLTFLTTALVATTAQAFLLPPTITESDSDIINTLPFEHVVTTQGRVIDVDCPGCPVAMTDIEGKMHFSAVESSLRLNYSIALGDRDQLLLNDIPIYPVDPQNWSMEPLVVDQLVKSPAGTWELGASPILGYSVTVSYASVDSDDGQLDLVLVTVEVMEVADKFVNGIPSMVIKLLSTPSGKLMIGDAETSAASPEVAAPTDSNKECTTLLCKWRAIITGKLSKVKGCAGKNRHGKHGSGRRPHGHGRPRPHHGAHPHPHHHRHGSFARVLRSIVLHVFIPIMIGLVVGVTTSLVGMVVGHLIVFVWRVLFRRGQRGQYHRVSEEADVKEEEIKSFLEHQGPPPTYEDAPAYEATIVDEKASE